MSQYVAEPLSRLEIRNYARYIRKVLNLDTTLMFPVTWFLEQLPKLTGDDDFYYYVVEDDELPINVHAEYDLIENSIKIKRNVYEGACAGSGRDRMTIIHEVGHYLYLKHSGMKFQRSFGEVACCRDPEWHAKCFAGELLIPAHLVKGMSAYEVSEKCGVSMQAATVQLSKIK